jgi:hypothetical protein
MVKHEGNVVAVPSKPDENVEQLPNEEKLLKLHPSFQM